MPDDFEDFGPWLHAQRRALGLHQAQFAKLLTAHGAKTLQSVVSAWERGTGRPTIDQYIAIARVLRLTMEQRENVEAMLSPLPTAQGASK